jgi:photosystem II stability/assembly factor-like uncharacterized protein
MRLNWLISSFAHGLLLAFIAAIAWADETGRRVADPLDRPAMLSRMAPQAVLLDVARCGSRVVAVGERGIVLLSDDNGSTWRQAKHVPVAVSLTRVAFVTDRLGWIVGHFGVVLHTTDGGETWTRQLDGITIASLSLKAAEAEVAALPNDIGALRRLQDAQRLVQDGADKPLLDLYFQDERRGFVVGAYGLLLRTEDGGQHWQPWMNRADNSKGLHLNAIARTGDSLFIGGERGLLLRSDDHGAHFLKIKAPYGGSFFTIAAEPDRLIVAGLRGNAFSSNDDGRTWTPLLVATPVSLISAAKLTDGRRLFVNQAGQLLSDNGEAALQQMSLPPMPPLTAVVQAADGWLIGVSMRGVLRFPLGL